MCLLQLFCKSTCKKTDSYLPAADCMMISLMFCSKSWYALYWFLSDNVVEILTSIIAMLLTTNVNAALTIQLFSQMFHFINVWLFNRLVRDRQLCTREWGRRLRHRLSRIEVWSEKQGLELAAECHLGRIIQVCRMIIKCSDIQMNMSQCRKIKFRTLHHSYCK